MADLTLMCVGSSSPAVQTPLLPIPSTLESVVAYGMCVCVLCVCVWCVCVCVCACVCVCVCVCSLPVACCANMCER